MHISGFERFLRSLKGVATAYNVTIVINRECISIHYSNGQHIELSDSDLGDLQKFENAIKKISSGD